MNASAMSFGAHVGFNLKSDEDKSRILKDLGESFGIQINRHRAVRYRACHATTLRRGNNYVAALQPSGPGYFLFLTRVNFAGVCIFVDKMVRPGHFYPRMILVHLAFDDRVFDDTVMEGHLLRCSDGQHVFLVTDLLADCGEALNERAPTTERIRRLHRILQHEHSPDDRDVCIFRAQPYFPISQLRDVMHTQLSRIEYACRGITFKPQDPQRGPDIIFVFPQALKSTGIEPGRHGPEVGGAEPEPEEDTEEEQEPEEEEQQEPEEEREFFAKRTGMPDVYELYMHKEDAGQRQCDHIAGVPTMEASRAMIAAFDGESPHAVVSLRFYFSPRFGKWLLHRTPIRGLVA